MSTQLEHQFSEIGKRLGSPPHSKDALLKILKQLSMFLSEVDQSPSETMLKAMRLSMYALVTPEMLRHRDRDVRLLVASCLSEITRITAPDAPYNDDILREIFQLIVATFQGLYEIHSPSFGKRVTILETVAKVRSCVVMLDLECDDLILEMFQIFFSIAREDHPENVLTSMQTIMTLVLDESEVISEQLLAVLLTTLRRENRNVSPAAYQLAMNVVQCLAAKLEPNLKHFLTSAMSAEGSSQNNLEKDYHEIIYSIYQCAPQMLQSIIPNLTQELLTDQLDVRLKSVKFLGHLFAFPGQPVAQVFQPLFLEFLKRFTDKAVEVRLLVVEHAKECLLANPFRPDASDIIAALSDRLLDFDETVRRQVVAAICDVANCALKSMPVDTIRQVADRLRDKTVSVRKYTLERLAEVYRVYCSKCADGSVSDFDFDWVPGKILRCCYDKDFRPQVVEVVFSESLFTSELSLAERVKHWIAMFSEFENPEVKALEGVLNQKQRLQLEMQNYFSLRQKIKEEDKPELQKQILSCFKTMSGSFKDPLKAEESFKKLNQMKDNNIWKSLSSLLDPSLTFIQAQAICDDLLKRLGDRHPQYEFMKILAIKCSHLLFGKEHVKEMLKEIAVKKLAGKDNIVQSSINLLVLFAGFFPSLVDGAEEELLQLLKEDNDYIKEGVVHILAKAGGAIREQMIQTSGSVDLLLEKLCLEGSRKQAKYAVQAIAAMTKDSGLKAFTVLYKRLVDMLESDDHLSTVLQSLGCIGQIAMPVFETREEDVIHFICRKLLRRSSNPADVSKTEWNERSEVCLLKIYGIKALVKSYLPKKDAHLRQRVKALFGVLTKFITSGEISDDVKSSTVDKAHLRLAAAKAVLRLSRQWDSHVTPQLFHLTLRIGQDAHPHVRKEFLAKVHRYLKERSLNHKYACAFVLSIPGLTEPDLAEVRQYLVEFIETCRRDTLLRQPSRQGDSNSYTDSPEHVLIYLVHALAHHPDFPVSDKGLRAEEFEPFYRQLHFFLSVMLHQNESRHSDPGKRSEIVNIPLIMAIFRRIKQVEDAVDKSKSENLYALCDLGILITKDLAHSQLNSGDCTRSLPLPELFYKPLEGSEGINLKVDGSSLPSCLVEIDAVRHFNAANSYQGDHLDLDQKPLKRNTHDNAYEGQSDKGDTKGQISKRTRNKRGRRMKETEYGEPKTPEILKPQLDDKSGMLHKSSGLGGFQSDGSRHPKRLESEKPSDLVQEQWKSTATEVKADQFKVAEDNVTSSVAEASVPPKRKRGRPSKETVELASAGRKQGLPEKDSSDLGSSRPKRGRPKSSGKTLDVKEETKSLEAQLQTSDMVIHDLSGALLMPSNDQLLETSKVSIHKSSKRSRKSDVEPSSEAKQLRKRKTADVVPGQLKVVEDNLISTNVEKLSAKRKRGRPSKESSELFSPVQKHGLAENVTEALGSSHRKRGRPKGSGKRSNDNGKTKVPDLAIMTTERVSDGLSGALLTPSNYQQFEVNKKSMQKLSKHHKKGLDASHGKGSKTVEKSPLVKMVSMEKITPDANSRNEHRREKKAGASPESADIKLHEDGKSPMGTPGKSLKKRSISVLDESPSGKFKKENEEAEKLVGHRIKVWWPLDEQFYVGTVDSYDPKQRKHKIIYHDGDIELLRLQKEQWEVIDGDSMHDKLVKPSVASPKSDGDKRAKKIINIDESPVIKQENSGTSSSKIRNETTSQSTGNPNDTGLLTRNFNANLSGINSLGGASVDPFVFTDDTDLPAHSNGRGRKKRGIEGNKGRRRTLSTKPTGRTVKNHKETKTEADDEKRDTRSDFGLKDSDDEPLNAWRFHKCKVH